MHVRAALALLGVLLAPFALAEPVDQRVEAGPAEAHVFFEQRRTSGAWWGANATDARANVSAAPHEALGVDAGASLAQLAAWYKPIPAIELRDEATALAFGAGARTPVGRVGADVTWDQRVTSVNGVSVCARDDLGIVLHEGPLGTSRYERDASCLVRFPALP